MLRAVGLSDEDFEKPLIGIANTWTDSTPCNVHLRDLASAVREGVIDAGLKIPADEKTFPTNDRINGEHLKIKNDVKNIKSSLDTGVEHK
jgi:dihydroxy-acid dehydratase